LLLYKFRQQYDGSCGVNATILVVEYERYDIFKKTMCGSI